MVISGPPDDVRIVSVPSISKYRTFFDSSYNDDNLPTISSYAYDFYNSSDPLNLNVVRAVCVEPSEATFEPRHDDLLAIYLNDLI